MGIAAAIAVVIEISDKITGTLKGLLGIVGSIVRTLGGVFKSLVGIVAKSVGSVVSLTGQMVGGILSTVADLGKQGAVVFAAASAGAAFLLGKMVLVSSEFEVMAAKMEVAMKGGPAGTAMMQWAEQFAALTPFNVPDIVDATVKLQMYGLSARKWLPLIGDMAGAMGRDVTDAVEAIADGVFGEMERLKEFGISSRTLLQFGATPVGGGGGGGPRIQGFGVDQFLPGKGGGGAKLSTQDRPALEKALLATMAAKFGGGMEKFSQTLRGMISNIEDSFIVAFRDIGNMLMPMIKEEWLPRIKTFGDGFGELVKPAITALIPLLRVVGNLMLGLGPFLTDKLPSVVLALQRSIPRLLPFISRIGEQLRTVLGWVIDNLVRNGPAAFEGLIKGITWLGDRLVEALPKIEAWGQAFWVHVTGAWDKLKPKVKQLWDALKTGLAGVDWDEAVEKMTDWLSTLSDSLSSVFLLIPDLTTILGDALAGLTDFVDSLNENIDRVVANINRVIAAINALAAVAGLGVPFLTPLTTPVPIVLPELPGLPAPGTSAPTRPTTAGDGTPRGPSGRPIGGRRGGVPRVHVTTGPGVVAKATGMSSRRAMRRGGVAV